jgi:hypothetical protein
MTKFLCRETKTTFNTNRIRFFPMLSFYYPVRFNKQNILRDAARKALKLTKTTINKSELSKDKYYAYRKKASFRNINN